MYVFPFENIATPNDEEKEQQNKHLKMKDLAGECKKKSKKAQKQIPM